MKANMKFRVVRFVSSREFVLIALHRKFTRKHAHEWLFGVHRVRHRKGKTRCFSATRSSRLLTGPSRIDSNCSHCGPSKRTARFAFLQLFSICATVLLFASLGEELVSFVMPHVYLSASLASQESWLHIRIVEAKNLSPPSSVGGASSLASPFCSIRVGSDGDTKQKTKTIKNTQNPVRA